MIPLSIALPVAAALLAGVAGFAAGKTWEANARDAAQKRAVESAVQIERAETERVATIAHEIGITLAQQYRATADARAALAVERKRHAAPLVDFVCPDEPAGLAGASIRLDRPEPVRFTADFVRLFDAGICIGASDCPTPR